jgi:hypothetical protein
LPERESLRHHVDYFIIPSKHRKTQNSKQHMKPGYYANTINRQSPVGSGRLALALIAGEAIVEALDLRSWLSPLLIRSLLATSVAACTGRASIIAAHRRLTTEASRRLCLWRRKVALLTAELTTYDVCQHRTVWPRCRAQEKLTTILREVLTGRTRVAGRRSAQGAVSCWRWIKALGTRRLIFTPLVVTASAFAP